VLANATNDATLADKAWAIQSTDEGFRQFALDWWAQHDPERARKECLNQLRDPLNEIVRVAAIRHLGRLKDVSGSRDVYNALVDVLDEGSFGALNTAIFALVEYGDKAAIPAIREHSDHSLFMIRRSAQGAVAALEARG
jgi:HEAT repeat protein